jgi:hypothetical protein
MGWLNTINDVLQRYSGQGGGTATASVDDAHEDFQQVARAAPRDVLADGISQMFRSDQTPAFPEMISNLFNQSDPNQRAGLLTHLLGSVGPGALAGIPALSGLAGLFGGGQVSPQQANQVSPEQVQQIAAHAEKHDPSIVEKVSSFYSQHPGVMKAVGGLALTIALKHINRRR